MPLYEIDLGEMWIADGPDLTSALAIAQMISNCYSLPVYVYEDVVLLIATFKGGIQQS